MLYGRKLAQARLQQSLRAEWALRRRFLIAVWLVGLALSAGWAGMELYRISWLKDYSIQTLTLLLFWSFAGRKAWRYFRLESRRPNY